MELLIHNLTTPHAKQLMDNSVDGDCALAAAVWCAYTLPIYDQDTAQWNIDQSAVTCGHSRDQATELQQWF